MKKRTRWFLISAGTLMAVVLTVVGFIYYSVADRLEIQGTIGPFRNEVDILRLDDTRLTSDSLNAFITSLMKKAHVHGLDARAQAPLG